MKVQIPVMMEVELLSALDARIEAGKRSEFICELVRDSLRARQKTAIEAAEEVVAAAMMAKQQQQEVENHVPPACPHHYWKFTPKKPARGTNAYCDTHTCKQCIDEAEEGDQQ
jgi:metal-responsive CopG/Arc/MetJ family transcriptional regulator